MGQSVGMQSVNSTLQSAVMMRAPLAAILPVIPSANISSHDIPGKPMATLTAMQSAHIVSGQQVVQHESISYQSSARFPSPATTQRINMYVTIDTKWVTALRHLVVNTFSDIVLSIRIQPVDHAKKMKVCLCFSARLYAGSNVIQDSDCIEERLMTAIMRTLPSAEFGRISCV